MQRMERRVELRNPLINHTIMMTNSRSLVKHCVEAIVLIASMLFLCVPTHSDTPLDKTGKLGGSNDGKTVKITQDNQLWWFDGFTPSTMGNYYHTTAILKITDSQPNAVYTWNVEQGATKVRLTQMTRQQALIESIGMSAAGAFPKNDIVIKVSRGQKAVAYHHMYILAPHYLDYLPNLYENVPDPVFGYVSRIPYRIKDQFNRPLPRQIASNENFTSITIPDTLTNWVRGPALGASFPVRAGGLNGSLVDEVSGQSGSAVPTTLIPGQPGFGTKVHHFTGTWNVGSEVLGEGIQMTSSIWKGGNFCVWQRYRGKAQHE